VKYEARFETTAPPPRRKLQAPSANVQHPEKPQAPKFKEHRRQISDLKLAIGYR
jgi:hypothetical protein